MIAKKRVLVTGAGGFIGRHSLEPLRAAGYEVHAVLSARADCTPQSGAPPSGTQVHRADLLDPQAIDALIEAVRPTHLLHFAWIVTPGVYWSSAENYRWLAASRQLIAPLRGQRRRARGHGGQLRRIRLVAGRSLP